MATKYKTELMNLSELTINPKNPRVIKDEKFDILVKSIKDFPEMLHIRPIVIDENNIVLGGNMRLKACKAAKLKQVPVIKITDLTDEQKDEFIIKDNVSGGEWDWQTLHDEWDVAKLEDWGLDVPGFDEEELEAQEDDFDATPPETPITVLGDLYEIGRKVWCKNCKTYHNID
jgi:ParB-like chromosome segregation protein Spo0J